MTRRAKSIRNALVAMRVVIQLWGCALTFCTSLNFYAFNVRETAVYGNEFLRVRARINDIAIILAGKHVRSVSAV